MGFLGSLLLLTRRLPAEVETELGGYWVDLHDLTGEDILVLVTGLQSCGPENAVRCPQLRKEVFGDGFLAGGFVPLSRD